MALRYKGGILSATGPTVTSTQAGGMWTTRQYFLAIRNVPVVASQIAYTTPGTYTFVVPFGVTSASVVCVGGGATAQGGMGVNYGGGGAGGLGWKNNITLAPGGSYTVVVGAAGQTNSVAPQNGGNSYFQSLSTVAGYGGVGAAGGSYVGDGGGNGGGGGVFGGGGGAGGYSGAGGTASGAAGFNAGSGGGAASGFSDGGVGGGSGGGGVGILGQGASGTAFAGQGGSGGANSTNNYGTVGALYGGGGGCTLGGSGNYIGGGNGAVRIIWGAGRAFPSTNTGNV